MGCFLTLSANEVVDFLASFGDDFFDPRGMNSTVGDQVGQRTPSHFAAYGIKAADHDHAWCIIDDDVDAGFFFEGADVTAFATDDATLHFVVRDAHRAGGGLGRVLGGVTLQRRQQHLAALLFAGFFQLLLVLEDRARPFPGSAPGRASPATVWSLPPDPDRSVRATFVVA